MKRVYIIMCNNDIRKVFLTDDTNKAKSKLIKMKGDQFRNYLGTWEDFEKEYNWTFFESDIEYI